MDRLLAQRLAPSAPTTTPQPKEGYLSGGLLSDVIDVLSTPAYAAAGLLQKGAPLQGIKERATWGEFLGEQSPELERPFAQAGKFKLTPANVLGTALDIIVDPLWLIPPAKIAKMLGAGAKAAGVTGKVSKVIETSPLAAKLDKAMVTAFGTGIKQDTRKALKVLEQINDRAVIEGNKLMEPAIQLSKQISKLPSETQNMLTKYIEAGEDWAPNLPAQVSKLLLRPRSKVLEEATQAGIDSKLLKELGDKAIEIDASVGRALVDAGLMDAKTFEKWRGKHLRRVYQQFEDIEAFIKELDKTDPRQAAELRSTMENMGVHAAKAKAPTMRPRIPLGAVAERKDLPLEQRQALGEITEAGYRLSRGAQVGTLAATRSKMLKEIADTFALDDIPTAGAEVGMPQLTKRGIQSLAGQPGTRELAEQLQRRQDELDRLARGYMKMPEGKEWGALAGKWVPELVHSQLNEWVRMPGKLEQISRKLVGGWKFGKVITNPATHARNMMSNLLLADNAGLSPSRVDIYFEAAKDLLGNGKWIQEAKQAGTAFIDTFQEAELKKFLDALEQSKGMPWSRVANAFGKIGAKIGDIYQFEEQWAKLAVYIFKRKSGVSPADAAKAAEEWLFNYRKVPKWVENMRSGRFGPLTIPFLTFSFKALPAYAKALYKNPARVARWGKYARGVERMAVVEPGQLAEEQKVQPKWMKQGMWMRLPIEDTYGRPLYLDMNYIIPFGDIFDAAGIFGTGPVPGFASMPFIEVLEDLRRNQSRFSGRTIWPKGSTPSQQRDAATRYIWDFMAPPLMGYSGRKIVDAWKQVPDWQGRTTQMDVTLAHVLGGIKTRPIKVDEERMWRVKEIKDEIRALRSNMRKVASDTRMPNADKEKIWAEGWEAIARLTQEIGEYAQ